jgi:thioredoxin reductase (NADPH)
MSADTETYPLLTEAQIARVRPNAQPRSVSSGDILYVPGDLAVPLYILLSASVEIVQPEVDGDRQVTMLLPRMFTGEAGMIGGQRAIVQARVASAGEVLEISPENLHALIARDSQLSEILLRAFLLRRLMLITRNLGNIILIGSRHSADTVRLRELLGRNGYPYTYVDLDRRAQRYAISDHSETQFRMQVRPNRDVSHPSRRALANVKDVSGAHHQRNPQMMENFGHVSSKQLESGSASPRRVECHCQA